MRQRREIHLDIWSGEDDRRQKKGVTGSSKKQSGVKQQKGVSPESSSTESPKAAAMTGSLRKRQSYAAAGLSLAGRASVVLSGTQVAPATDTTADVLASALGKHNSSEIYFNFLLFGRFGYIGARVAHFI
jgi:hypothetical protein